MSARRFGLPVPGPLSKPPARHGAQPGRENRLTPKPAETMNLRHKHQRLKDIITAMDGCLIGFSGGVDSTFLFAVAVELLGERVLAVTARSAIHPRRELHEARRLASLIGGRLREIDSGELEIPEFRDNPRDRCYCCKRELFGRLREIADQERLPHLLDGSNLDDLGDHRPGRRAARELGVRSPLEEAGLTKDDIRRLSRSMILPTWNKPALACLASRFPYGTTITAERLGRVDRAEDALHGLGFRTLRVRYHGDVARLELGEDEYAVAIGPLRERVIRCVKEAGFVHVAVDLQGYRTGALNESGGDATEKAETERMRGGSNEP